ncbi:MAG: site-specific integrase [Ruminococcus flavefaciens]|nr:site-specific integrase [Ruminococcus flavefaciens]
MKERESLLSKHPYAISKGKDGKWRTYFPDKEKGRRMIKKSTKEDVEKEVITYWKQKTENPTVKTIFYEWINRKLEYHDICRGTLNRYETDFKKFFEDDSNFGNMRIRQIKSYDIVPFLRKAIVTYSLTAKSYSNLRTLTYGIFKYAKEKEYISWSISQTINDMELPSKAFRKVIKEDNEEVFDDEELDKLLKYLSVTPDIINLGIILMFCTGCRVGELVAIRWSDVNGNAIKIRRTEITYKNDSGETVCEIRDYPKTEAGVRTVFVPEEFSSIIRRLKLLSGNQEYVFWKDGNNIKAMQIRKRLYLICKRIGVKKKSPHKLRKTYVSILLDNGVDKRLVQDVAGHAQISTSERNYHRNRKSDKRKEEILSELPEFRNAKLMF